MKTSILSFCFLLLAFVSGPAMAEAKATTKPLQGEGIAATVNDAAITVSDVNDRLKLMIITSGLPYTPDMQDRMRGQVLNMLIDETLQTQEASRMELKVTPEEVENGFATIAKQNKLEVEKFKSMLTHDKISLDTLEDQIKAQIAWGKVVQRKLRPQVEISDGDVGERKKFLESSVGKTQYLLAQIYLPVDAAGQDPEMKAMAERLRGEITEGHAPFQQVAQQFSQEAAAARGGDLGWVQEGQLPDTLNGLLATMKEGEISAPTRSLTGYHILLLRGKRTVQPENIPQDEQILQQIGNERLDRLQRRYLMDLKAEAFIERRV